MNNKKEIPSPCISVCTIEEDTGFCRGCFRSLTEIAQWKALSDEDRTRVMDELPERRQKHGSSHPYA